MKINLIYFLKVMDINFPKKEEEILDFWKKEKIFEKTLERGRAKKGLFSRFLKPKVFVFFEGPPTANGVPGIHHFLARIFKDIICRYKTMRGFLVERKAGWDTHGLPVELEVEKKMGFKSKQDIERYGIAKFNEACKKSVWEYKGEWERLTERIGFWLDMEHPYITYDNNYIETLWWEIKKIWEKGLLSQDYKVVPYCPRCGTPLSGHEVAQGYKKVKDPAIYIKFKIKNFEERFNSSKKDLDLPEVQERFLLVWTTTPWTLPANVAIAVNPKLKYVEAQVGFTSFILAKEKAFLIQDSVILREFNGDDLCGLEYEPLYLSCDPQICSSAFRVIKGNFVNAEDGTGLVHIAPAFGVDDLEVIKKENENINDESKKIPILVTVDEKGNFKGEVRKFAGMFVKEADPLIIQDLKERGVLYKEEAYEHDYPFCWRCGTPLLYYAKKSWFIGVQKIKNELIKNNQKINWVPNHLKEGRFGEWLREIKDWAVSRERYWGTPLPVWQCERCENIEVLGSKKDFISQKVSKNNYFVIRHGRSVMNEKEIIISTLPEKVECPLTKEGEESVRQEVEKIKKEKIKIDLIFSSDLLRTKQTSEIIAKELGIKEIIFDSRLRDIQAGDADGKSIAEYFSFWKDAEEMFTKTRPGGECYNEVKIRMYNFIKEIDKKYEGRNILIVSHQRPLAMLEGAVLGLTSDEFSTKIEPNKIKTGEFRRIKFKQFPYDLSGELDLHRPYVDEVEFLCEKCGFKMKRVSEVIDCWFDSGSMPFAQWHWPFENEELITKRKQFPAEFISEAVDQTRGWFYTLLAVSTLLGFEAPYKNVISLGHVLDKKGEKMSKSKGNAVSPWDQIEKYGVDVLRWYFFTGNQPGEPKRFDEDAVKDFLNKFILTLWNSFVFFETYKSQNKSVMARNFDFPKSKNILDEWIISKTCRLIKEVRNDLDKYDITSAGRAIEKFTVEDLSNWYIRRSRKRFQKSENEEEKNQAIQTSDFVMLTLSKLCAPFIPFLSEVIFRSFAEKTSGFLQSVHLSDFPKEKNSFINKTLEEQMDDIRKICTLALMVRAKAGIKVRQPLLRMEIKIEKAKTSLNEKLLELIKEELNIKEISLVKEIEKEIKNQRQWLIETEGKITVAIDSEITPELKEEGIVREVVRQIQELRKKAAFTPEDRINVFFSAENTLEELIKKNKKSITKDTLADDLIFSKKECLAEKTAQIDKEEVWLGVTG